jgi:ABC-type transport system involved in cytochrome c biogenesis permease subunit
MIGRLTVLCFGGTYALALASELARFAVRSKARWYLTLALTMVGWLVHGVYLVHLGVVAGDLPVRTIFESLLVLAWILAAVDIYLVVRSPQAVAVAVFLLPVVLILVSVAGLWAPRASWAESGVSSAIWFWGMAHGIFLLLGAVSTFVAFAAGLMYLAQASRLKHKRPPRFGFALPSLEHSERWNRAAITIAFPLLTIGLVIGMCLILAHARLGSRQLAWSDPKVLFTAVLWLLFALLLNARYRPELRGRSVMLLTVIATAFLLFTWVGVDLLFPTAHGAAKSASEVSPVLERRAP